MMDSNHENRLIHEKSPYLLQHAHNPVDWYPWGEEAFERAIATDKPIFLSIGYSTCHWCHVMERESFEDEQVAKALNRGFIAIKVDREERPDIDHIYMAFCQVMTGGGGWPLTVILTPKKKPFFAGTYFPKEPKYGHPGLLQLLEQIQVAWKNNRPELLKSGRIIEEALVKAEKADSDNLLPADSIKRTYWGLEKSFDPIFGGFGREPKFPSPHNLSFLIRYHLSTGNVHALDMVEVTLDSLYKGGIFDHIGFGFSRYSTDPKWLVPHFEKMLYDNALLTIAYIEAYAVTGKSRYGEIAEKILTYLVRDMTHPLGGFYSAEDADSEGEEGKFYIFTRDEVDAVLGDDSGFFCRHYDITQKGNFEGANIPNLIQTNLSDIEKDRLMASNLEECRLKLLKYREQRIHPFKDDKILTAWNGLMIAAAALAGRLLKNDRYIQIAQKSAQFIIDNLVDDNGRLLARYREGEAAQPGFIDDYAFMIWGLIELYEATLDPAYLEKSVKWSNDMIRLFRDPEKGGFYIYGNDSETLILRPKEIYDGAIPSGNSVATLSLLRLAAITGNQAFEEVALSQFRTFAAELNLNPTAYTHLMMAFLCAQNEISEIVISGDRNETRAKEMLAEVRSRFLPFSVFRHQDEGEAAVHICSDRVCKPPITDLNMLKNQLDKV